MKTKMGKVMVAVVACAMVFSAASAYAGEGWNSHKSEADTKKHFDKMAEELKLTAEQKAALEKQREEARPKMKALKERQRAAREQLRAELDKQVPDKATLAAIVEDLKTLTGEHTQAKIDKVLAMKKVLTPEQSAKMKTIMDAKKKEFEDKRTEKSGKDSPHDDL
jgi:Spy/CpxP family protein refolding chaperone